MIGGTARGLGNWWIFRARNGSLFVHLKVLTKKSWTLGMIVCLYLFWLVRYYDRRVQEVNEEMALQILQRCLPGFNHEISNGNKMWVSQMDSEVCFLFYVLFWTCSVMGVLEMENDVCCANVIAGVIPQNLVPGWWFYASRGSWISWVERWKIASTRYEGLAQEEVYCKGNRCNVQNADLVAALRSQLLHKVSARWIWI